MRRLVSLAVLSAVWAGSAAAQEVDHSAHAPASAEEPAADPHAGHDMSAPQGAPPVPDRETAPPPAPTDHLADRFFAPAAMARARGILSAEHGGGTQWQVMANELEYQAGSGEDGYRWDGEAWYGGDIHRFVFRTEGESGEDGLESAEVQTLYSRALARYTDLQLGLRHDFEPGSRTYAVVGFETLLPYWIEAEGALFLSGRGDVLARAEGSYDLRLTQRLVLQPSVEFNFAVDDVPEIGVGSGLSDGEVALRLRYEIRREFAPYVGVSWERRFGRTADYARAAGEDVEATRFVVGIRGWF